MLPEQRNAQPAAREERIVRDFARICKASGANETTARRRREVEILQRILGLNRLRLRGPSGVKDELIPAATAQDLRKLTKLCPTTAPAMRTG
ncbi:hypothetical protein C357_21800 [Citreicella sp. 357]|nr:hypothetical protein C357_21800 [Citreicella sp. 357]